jgi:large subunit ribosomal protein L7/L12
MPGTRLAKAAQCVRYLAPTLFCGRRSTQLCLSWRHDGRRWSTVSAQAAPHVKTQPNVTESGDARHDPVDERVGRLADEILSLNLLQAKQLSDVLRSRLGIEGTPALGGGALTPAALAAMQQAMFTAGNAAAGAQAAATGSAEKTEEKSEFDVVLEKYDAAKKIQVIKEVRSALGLGLKEAKELVEAAPKVIKSAVPKNEAEALVDRLKQFGSTLALK